MSDHWSVTIVGLDIIYALFVFLCNTSLKLVFKFMQFAQPVDKSEMSFTDKTFSIPF